jgi:hypothetical protein
MAIRIQRKRTKGWKMPENTVYVGRPTKWGNPFKLKAAYGEAARDLCTMDLTYRNPINEGARDLVGYARKLAMRNYRTYLDQHPELKELARKELKGKNLACWCPVNGYEPCHADILLEIANS